MVPGHSGWIWRNILTWDKSYLAPYQYGDTSEYWIMYYIPRMTWDDLNNDVNWDPRYMHPGDIQ